MKNKKTVRVWWVVGTGLYAAMWLGGVASYVLLGAPPPDAEWTAPVFLALAAALVLGYADSTERRVLLWGGLIGFGAEVLGVATGFPFGVYHYTATLAPKLLGVPLVLVAAWLVLFAYVRTFTRSPLWGAVWMTGIDLVIDPLAAHSLSFWTWERGGLYYDIPWTNFAGWFGVSLILFTLFRKRGGRPYPAARVVGAGLVLFFTIIALGTGLFLAGAIGLGLLGAHGITAIREARRSGAGMFPVYRDKPSR